MESRESSCAGKNISVQLWHSLFLDGEKMKVPFNLRRWRVCLPASVPTLFVSKMFQAGRHVFCVF